MFLIIVRYRRRGVVNEVVGLLSTNSLLAEGRSLYRIAHATYVVDPLCSIVFFQGSLIKMCLV